MLTDSTSPHSALKSLLCWLALPETKEVLQYLKDKAEVAQREANKSPLMYVDKNGAFMEMSLIRTVQDRYRGAMTGFSELQRILAERQTELEQLIAEQDPNKNQQDVS